MSGSTANDQLSAYLDGELSDLESAELEEQLAADPTLRSELGALREAADFMRTHGPVQAPPGFAARVLDRVEHEPAPGRWWRWLRRPLGIPVEGLAVAVAAAVVLFIALDLGDQPEMSEGPAAAPVQAAPEGVDDQAGAEEPDAVADLEPAPDAWDTDTLRSTVSKRAPPPKAPAKTIRPATSSSSTKPTAPTQQEASGSSEAQAPTPARPPMVSVPYASYQVQTYDPQVLAKLQKLVGKLGGTILDEGGTPITTGHLEPGSRQVVRVVIPSATLAQFDDDIHGLGMLTKYPGQSDMMAMDTVPIPVTIEVMPSSIEDKALDPPPRSMGRPAN